jgi:hypothetical protein
LGIEEGGEWRRKRMADGDEGAVRERHDDVGRMQSERQACWERE